MIFPNYTITKLDKRHTGHETFKYSVQYGSRRGGPGILGFDRSRRYLTEAYGYTQEIQIRDNIVESVLRNTEQADSIKINPYWAFSLQYNDYRIYLKGDAELSWVKLKYPEYPEA